MAGVDVQAKALQLNAMSEVISGFGLIFNSFMTRGLVRGGWLPFAYFNMMRVRYANPECAAQQQVAWEQVGQYINPVIRKIPVLEKPVGWVKTWFTNPGRRV